MRFENDQLYIRYLLIFAIVSADTWLTALGI